MMITPAVSILIPAFHAKDYIEGALGSVRSQTFTNWELIVTEDGSNDGTEQLVRYFKSAVQQPVCWQRSERNRGLPATRNSGIAAAQGEYVALLDADDYWAPEHIETLRNILGATTADIAHSGSVLFDSASGRTLEVRAPGSEAIRNFPFSLYRGTYVIQPSSIMINRRLLKRVGGFNESFRYVEDREMWLRCARAGAHFVFSGKNTCFYRKHSAALSTHAAEMAIAAARVFEQHLDWKEIPEELRLRSAAGTLTAAARIVQRSKPCRARRFVQRAQRISPRFSRLLWAAALRLYAVRKSH